MTTTTLNKHWQEVLAAGASLMKEKPIKKNVAAEAAETHKEKQEINKKQVINNMVFSGKTLEIAKLIIESNDFNSVCEIGMYKRKHVHAAILRLIKKTGYKKKSRYLNFIDFSKHLKEKLELGLS